VVASALSARGFRGHDPVPANAAVPGSMPDDLHEDTLGTWSTPHSPGLNPELSPQRDVLPHTVVTGDCPLTRVLHFRAVPDPGGGLARLRRGVSCSSQGARERIELSRFSRSKRNHLRLRRLDTRAPLVDSLLLCTANLGAPETAPEPSRGNATAIGPTAALMPPATHQRRAMAVSSLFPTRRRC